MNQSESPDLNRAATSRHRSRAQRKAQRAAEQRYWEFFINTAPDDPRNSLVGGIRSAEQGSINSLKSDLHTPEIMSEHIKEIGRKFGAALVGVVALGAADEGSSPAQAKFAVISVVKAENDPESSPGIGGQLPVQNGLLVSFVLAAFLRESGYFATMEQRSAVELAAFASRAGLGTLDRRGRLVTKEHGAKVWVADAVYTDFPLVGGS